jgi:F-box-like
LFDLPNEVLLQIFDTLGDVDELPVYIPLALTSKHLAALAVALPVLYPAPHFPFATPANEFPYLSRYTEYMRQEQTLGDWMLAYYKFCRRCSN